MAYFYHWPPSVFEELTDWEMREYFNQAKRINKEQERASKGS